MESSKKLKTSKAIYTPQERRERNNACARAYYALKRAEKKRLDPCFVPGKRGPKIKYHTEEERILARKEACRKATTKWIKNNLITPEIREKLRVLKDQENENRKN